MSDYNQEVSPRTMNRLLLDKLMSDDMAEKGPAVVSTTTPGWRSKRRVLPARFFRRCRLPTMTSTSS